MTENGKKTQKKQVVNTNSINGNDILFQVSDWDYYHENIEFGDDTIKKYVIRMYGTTKDNKKIFVKVKDYTPYFYVEIPKNWNKQKVQILMDTVKKEVEKSKPELVSSLKEWDLVDKHIFREFTNYKFFTFVRLIFHGYDGFKAYERVFNRAIRNIVLHPKPKKYKLYESNIEPFLRCMHIRKLNAVGWVKLSGGKYNHFSEEDCPSTNDISVYTEWTNLEHVEDTTIVPLIIAAFDIECTSGDGTFPQPQRDEDKVIQIGTTFSRYGESECFYKHIITLGSCDKLDGADVESYDNEVAVLLAWTKLIRRMNPDIITGYNIFGFDFKYLDERAKKLGCHQSFSKLGRIKGENSPFIDKILASSALGENKLQYYAMQGRVNIDIMKVVQRDFKLGSYKLDNVAAEFIKEGIEDVIIDNNIGTSTIKTKSTYGLEKGRYIKIYFNDGLSDNSYKNEAKFRVISFTDKSLTVDGILDGESLELKKYKVYWCQAKDDVSANDIFRLQKGSSKDRAIIAYYCLQDCSLCNKLMNKLQILTNNIGMANVCHVPLSYIFLRGQGVKIFSLVSKKCRERNHVIPVIRKPFKPKESDEKKIPSILKKKFEEEEAEEEDTEGYEGATVFEPYTGVHFEPISVLDYNSLYPNSMRFRGLSHECLVKDPQYDNLDGYYYNNVTYSNKDNTTTTCRYAVSIKGQPGILCEILTELLDARNKMKELAEEEPDPFKKKILDGLQLAYKITANSLYGQCGAPTSPIYLKDIAASTTATGREMLNAARIFAEIIFPILVNAALFENFASFEKKINILFQKKIDELIGEENINKLKQIVEGENDARYQYIRIFTENRGIIDDKKFVDKKLNHTCKKDFIKWVYDKITTQLAKYKINPLVIYGDTDSIFIKFGIADKETNINDTSHEALKISIELGQLCGKLLHKILPVPQNMLYEKTFWPFVILSKKRYVGNKYETDPNKYYQNSMGIVLKRRDNAPIVKIVVGGIVKSILNDKSSDKAVEFTKKTLRDILSCKYTLDKFIITKTLKGNALTKDENKLEVKKPKDQRAYADRSRIVHAVLADRMADRDPGNRPQSNERIPYAYILTEKEVELQGERVEHPEYIVENKLPLDYLFYITNQIMKPSIQFLEHVIENPNKIFEDCIMKEMNRRVGKRPLSYYFNLLKEDTSDPFGEDTDDEDDDPSTIKNNITAKFNPYNEEIELSDNEEENEDSEEFIVHKMGKKLKTDTKPKKKKIKQVSQNKSSFDNLAGGFILEI
ncbi:DNA-directed DNA polymerase family B [Fadolivirus algeromassiliense]|jgi:DNA polymerase elongation subunit (family B)|uniref:DNA polymerase n=1 Tax=Fadolivirus FV1/VV64 TaxID=3070911 RepID=A0A7D3QU31_9VIRU|nr:DNA-directed DNA polymerase family B [Fadolivirus algeromassiliense]QKF93823.1 DNA-directed DNA polymerase family B [Fadolivirus FV1/VV64]